jgi:GT2 family glycosyltransferase
MPEKKAAVVILNWNTCNMLKEFLPKVVKNSKHKDITIVVADNGSTDGSAELVKDQFPEVRLICLNENYGFAGGYNRALKQIKEPYTVLLNSDVVPAPNWLHPLIERMESLKDIAACVPKIKALENNKMFEYAGAAGGFIDKWGYPFCRGRIFNSLEEDHGQYNDSGEIFWGSGAALMVRTKSFNESGGLDEHFFAHMEEIDWCWRMKNQGMRIWYCSQSEIYHKGGGTLNAMSPHKTYLNFRNNLFMLYRNLPLNSLNKTIFIRLILDGITAARFLSSGKWSHLMAVFKAHRDFFKRKPFLKKERAGLQKKSISKNHKEIYPHSIVLDFFVKKKRRFSDLKF